MAAQIIASGYSANPFWDTLRGGKRELDGDIGNLSTIGSWPSGGVAAGIFFFLVLPHEVAFPPALQFRPFTVYAEDLLDQLLMQLEIDPRPKPTKRRDDQQGDQGYGHHALHDRTKITSTL